MILWQIFYFLLDKNIINRNFNLENVRIEKKMSLYVWFFFPFMYFSNIFK